MLTDRYSNLHYHFTQEKNYYDRLIVYHDDHSANIKHANLSEGFVEPEIEDPYHVH